MVFNRISSFLWIARSLSSIFVRIFNLFIIFFLPFFVFVLEFLSYYLYVMRICARIWYHRILRKIEFSLAPPFVFLWCVRVTNSFRNVTNVFNFMTKSICFNCGISWICKNEESIERPTFWWCDNGRIIIFSHSNSQPKNRNPKIEWMVSYWFLQCTHVFFSLTKSTNTINKISNTTKPRKKNTKRRAKCWIFKKIIMFKKSREKKLLTNKQMEYFELCSFREEEISRCSYFVDKFYCIEKRKQKKNLWQFRSISRSVLWHSYY